MVHFGQRINYTTSPARRQGPILRPPLFSRRAAITVCISASRLARSRADDRRRGRPRQKITRFFLPTFPLNPHAFASFRQEKKTISPKFFFRSSVRQVHINYFVILHYSKLYTLSTWFSTAPKSLWDNGSSLFLEPFQIPANRSFHRRSRPPYCLHNDKFCISSPFPRLLRRRDRSEKDKREGRLRPVPAKAFLFLFSWSSSAARRAPQISRLA